MGMIKVALITWKNVNSVTFHPSKEQEMLTDVAEGKI